MIVTVYTAPDCMQCGQTKKVLNRRGVTFDEVDVREPLPAESERSVGDWLRDEHGFTSVPVVYVKHADGTDEWWAGFRDDKLRDLHPVHV